MEMSYSEERKESVLRSPAPPRYTQILADTRRIIRGRGNLAILHSPNRGGFLRLPMPKNNRLIRPRVTH